MTSTITVPNRERIATSMTELADQLIAVATAARADLNEEGISVDGVIAAPNWFLSALGVPTNDGLTLTTPITPTEFTRRVGQGYPTFTGAPSVVISPHQQITINVLTDMPESEPLALRATIPANSTLAIVGRSTVLHTGTVTTVIVLDRDTNVPWQMTDVGVADWTPYIGHRVRITSGANAGQVFWIAENTAGTATLSAPNNPNLAQLPDSVAQRIPTEGVITAGDPYVIEQLTTLYQGDIDIRCNLDGSVVNPTNGFTANVIGFADLNLKATGSRNQNGIQTPLGNAIPQYKACRFDGRFFPRAGGSGLNTLTNCCNTPNDVNAFISIRANAGATALLGGLCLYGSVVPVDGASIIADFDYLVWKGFAFGGHSLTIGTCGIFGSVSAGLVIGGDFAGEGADRVWIAPVFNSAAESHLYGKDNGSVGVSIGSGCTFVVGESDIVLGPHPAAKITITGATGNASLGGALVARPWDNTLGVYGAEVALTWANLFTAFADSPSGGGLHNPAKNAHIVDGTDLE